MGILDINRFGSILGKLMAKHSQLPRERSTKGTSVQLPIEEVQQLLQAAEWLKPPGHKAQTRWRPGPACTQSCSKWRQNSVSNLHPFQGKPSYMMLLQLKACSTELRFIVWCTGQ